MVDLAGLVRRASARVAATAAVAIVAVVAVVGAVGPWSAGPAQAAGSSPGGLQWSAPADVGTAAISCPVAGTCVAVSAAGQSWTYTGGSWAAPVAIPGNDPQAISCTSASFCVAVGYQTATPPTDAASLNIFDGTSWSAPTTFTEPLPTGATFTSMDLWSVSCTSPSFCAAVGNRVVTTSSGTATSSSAVGPFAVTYDGTSWSAPVTIEPSGSVQDVSCASPTFCVAASSTGTILTWDGTSWSTTASLPVGVLGIVGGVSCASPTFCVVGAAVAGSSLANGEVFVFDGRSWSAPTTVTSGTVAILDSVTCPSATFCLAGADEGGLIASYDGTSWSASSIDPSSTSNEVVNGVSCASSTFCGVATDLGVSIGTTQPPEAQPVVTSVTPPTGPAAGGAAVTITGTGFAPGATVNFSGIPATGVTVVDTTTITATAPATAGTPFAGGGTTYVEVTTGGGSSATGPWSEYTFGSVPTVTMPVGAAGGLLLAGVSGGVLAARNRRRRRRAVAGA